MGGRRSEGERAKAAAMVAAGTPLRQVCEELGLDPSALWRWRQDPEFRAMVDRVIRVGLTEAAQQMRALAPLVLEAFERGLRSNSQMRAMKVAQWSAEGEEWVREERIELVAIPDDSLAVHTADLVSRRIPELMPREGLDVDVDASERLLALIRRVDARDERSRADGGAPTPSA